MIRSLVACIGIDARIEILPGMNAVFLKIPVNLISAESKLMESDRHIGIVKLDIMITKRQQNPRNIAEHFHIPLKNRLALLNPCIHMPEIAKSHRSAKFIHFTIGTDRSNLLLTQDTEIFKLIQLFHKFLIRLSRRNGSTLYGIKHLGCMEGKHRSVSVGADPLAIITLPKGMRGIINHLEMMLVRNFLYIMHCTDIAVYMHRHNSARFRCDQRFQLIYINCIIPVINITEDRLQPVPYDGMGSRRK